MKDAIAFLKSLQADPKAKDLIRTMEIPADPDKAADCYVSLAGKLGYTLTKEEILAAAHEMLKAQQQKTDRDAEKFSLSEDDLDNVAGGLDDPGHSGCASTWNDDEWCWVTDSCSVVINYYDGDVETSPEHRDPGDIPDINEMEWNPD